jgi:hypothetical protein
LDALISDILRFDEFFFSTGSSMQQTELPYFEASILGRLVGFDSVLPAGTVKSILTLKFSDQDKECMRKLAAKARAGSLSRIEQKQVEAYSRVSSLLGILKSKARQSFKQRVRNGKAKAHQA